ncbi:threonine synthase [Cavenderia fasciculata]|uniref:Threonine synthase n=1 Tax=Cavenderia fasciculata TaxID=261658 RepID=F4QBD2_CACFS|nr:threonine synthase [Cavenderia fasciculata]EGG14904.1 threonine synthase [Cavenderia fasciculata]|eukprot:XP_004351420.1 threonine synthase [Cavenderia fasciculata]
MKYKSTRGNVKNLSFIDAFMMGLADDGGLIVPESIPIVDKDRLAKMSSMSFVELTVEIMSIRKQTMSVLVATSGDTGSAAIHGLANKKGVNVFVLYPQGRVSPVQELQMVTVQDANVHPITITNSSFDDCQTLVKQIFSDLPFKSKYNLAAVNSINWARILVQIVYYFYSYFLVQKKQQTTNKEVVFSVPTGNFGDVLAGFYAKKMGLPIRNLIVSTNQNDILDKFFKTGRYDKSCGDVIPTVAPSMDIKIASNFERYLYYVCQEDASKLRQLMEDFNRDGVLSISPDILANQVHSLDGFLSSSVGHQEILDTIKTYYQTFNYLVDPHTAIGIAGSKSHGLKNLNKFTDNPLICLSTAHPAKFGDTVKLATNVDIENQYQATKQLLEKKQSKLNVNTANCNIEEIKQFISNKRV